MPTLQRFWCVPTIHRSCYVPTLHRSCCAPRGTRRLRPTALIRVQGESSVAVTHTRTSSSEHLQRCILMLAWRKAVHLEHSSNRPAADRIRAPVSPPCVRRCCCAVAVTARVPRTCDSLARAGAQAASRLMVGSNATIDGKFGRKSEKVRSSNF